SKQPVLATDRDAAQGPVRRHCYRPCCSPPPYLCHFPVVDHGGPTSGTWLGGGGQARMSNGYAAEGIGITSLQANSPREPNRPGCDRLVDDRDQSSWGWQE